MLIGRRSLSFAVHRSENAKRTGGNLVRAISLYAALLGVWLLLSGFFSPFFLSLAAVCCALVVYIALRMDVIDQEGHPIQISWRLIPYLPWLAWQIVRANLDVTRRVFSLDIDPVLRWVPASQRTDLGTVIYANSITLTPGTVSTDVEPGRIRVHALSGDGIAELEKGEMDARVHDVEG